MSIEHSPHHQIMDRVNSSQFNEEEIIRRPEDVFASPEDWDKWLLKELSATVPFVLSIGTQDKANRILFSGYNSALHDALGYSNTELLDSPFGRLMNERDSVNWRSMVDKVVQAKTSDTIGMFVRLKRKASSPLLPSTSAQTSQRLADDMAHHEAALQSSTSSETLFEIRGHVHFAGSSQTSQPKPLCILAMATPYSSSEHPESLLLELLEAKIEHERLLNRLRWLQARSKKLGKGVQRDTTPTDTKLRDNSLHSTNNAPDQSLQVIASPLCVPMSPSGYTDANISYVHSSPSSDGASTSGSETSSPYDTASPPSSVSSLDYEDEENNRKKVSAFIAYTACHTISLLHGQA